MTEIAIDAGCRLVGLRLPTTRIHLNFGLSSGRGGGTGRRARLKIWWERSRESSSLSPGTNIFNVLAEILPFPSNTATVPWHTCGTLRSKKLPHVTTLYLRNSDNHS